MGFEPAIPAIERLQIYALDFMATGIGKFPEYITLSTVPLGGNAVGAYSCCPCTQNKRVRLHNLHKLPQAFIVSFLTIKQLNVNHEYETAYTKSINLVMHLSSPSSSSSPSASSSSSSSSSSFSYFSNSRRMV